MSTVIKYEWIANDTEFSIHYNCACKIIVPFLIADQSRNCHTTNDLSSNDVVSYFFTIPGKFSIFAKRNGRASDQIGKPRRHKSYSFRSCLISNERLRDLVPILRHIDCNILLLFLILLERKLRKIIIEKSLKLIRAQKLTKKWLESVWKPRFLF